MTTSADEAALRAELELGEALEWIGRPAALTLARRRFGGIVFVLGWTGVVGSVFTTESASGRLGLSAAVSGAMLALGAFAVFHAADSLLNAWGTVYAITDRRVLRLERGLRRNVTSWTPQQITSVQRRDRSNGRGDIVFHQSEQPGPDGPSLVSAAFVDVADVRAVKVRVRRLASY